MLCIETTPGELDDVKNKFDFMYFCVRNGKAKYHILHLADNSCGLYYAYRVGAEGLEGRRAIEPDDLLRCFCNQF